jgi:hypothetical protein
LNELEKNVDLYTFSIRHWDSFSASFGREDMEKVAHSLSL